AAAPLVKQDDPVALRVEEGAHFAVGAATGAAVNKHGGLALGVAAFFVINLVEVGDPQEAGPVGLDGRVERTKIVRGHGGFALRERGGRRTRGFGGGAFRGGGCWARGS